MDGLAVPKKATVGEPQKPLVSDLELADSQLMVPYRKILDAKFAANMNRWDAVKTLVPQVSQELRNIADSLDEAFNKSNFGTEG